VGSESARKIAADRRHQYAVAGGEAGDRCAHLGDGADGLVVEDPPVGHGLHVAVEDVQVGPADRGGLDPDDDVGRATLAVAGWSGCRTMRRASGSLDGSPSRGSECAGEVKPDDERWM
jgi:hypothetical protein